MPPPAPPPPPPPPTGIELATAALDELDPPPPEIRTASPTDQYVGIPMWMWVSEWEPVTVEGSAGGVGVKVTATPVGTTWSLTEAEVACDGPGQPFVSGSSDVDNPSPCSYTFDWSSRDRPDGRYPARTTIAWDVAWVATDGTDGTFPAITTSTDFSLRVLEAEATTD